MTYAQIRDLYHRSFGDDVLRQRLLLFLVRNPQLKKLHSLFSQFFFYDDFRAIGIEPYGDLLVRFMR
jgi:hypothetical protein